jgi:ADP-ribosyl-[dinitrogen reductase] hydrolase
MGCLYGIAIGDAMGMPMEWLTRHDAERLYGANLKSFVAPLPPHPHARRLRAGMVTDDTWVSLALLRSLVKARGYDEAQFKQELGDWAKSLADGTYNRGAGSTTLRVAQGLAAGQDMQGERSPTCGAAIRVAPVGLLYAADPFKARELGAATASVTHTHPVAVDGAALLAESYARFVNARQANIAALIKAILRSARSMSDVGFDLATQIQRIIDRLYFERFEHILPTSQSSDTRDVVASALGYLAVTNGDFRMTALLSASGGGDSDSIASIACGLSGALFGVSAIPSEWLAILEEKNPDEFNELTEFGHQLFRILSSNHPGATRVPLLRRDGDIRSLEKNVRQTLLDHGVLDVPHLARKYGRSIVEVRDAARSIESPETLEIPGEPIFIALDDRGVIRASRYLQQVVHEASPSTVDRVTGILMGLLASDNSNIAAMAAVSLVGLEVVEALPAMRRHGFVVEAEDLAMSAYRKQIVDLANNLRHFRVEGESIALTFILSNADFSHILVPIPFSPSLDIKIADPLLASSIRGRSLDGGIYLVDLASGRLSGAYQIREDVRESVGFGFRLDVPVDDSILAAILKSFSVEIISIYSSASKIYKYTANLDAPSEEASVEILVREQCDSRGIDFDYFKFVVSVAHQASVSSRHGAIFCVVKGDRLDQNVNWIPLPNRMKIRSWPIERLLRCASQDGATIIDSSTWEVLGYRYLFAPTAGEEAEAFEKSRNILMSHGSRHMKSAAYSIHQPSSLIVVVSERGTVTIFADGAALARME